MSDQGHFGDTVLVKGPSASDSAAGDIPLLPRLIADASAEEECFLRWLGFSKPLIAAMKLSATRNGTTIETEMLASGQVREDAYYAAFAKALGLRFVEEIAPSMVRDTSELDTQLRQPSILRLTPSDGPSFTVFVPQARHAAGWRRRIDASETLQQTMAVVTPSALRRAVWQAGAARRADAAADKLFDEAPEMSARSVLTGGQGFLAGFLLTAYVSCLLLAPMETLHATHVGLSLAFCILIMLRAIAIRKGLTPEVSTEIAEDDNLPVYTVLVALYREKEIVSQLVAALLRLDWPHSRLDIKLVCEADDAETLDALAALNLPLHFEVVEVPNRAPRTKPKALNYALAGARGDYLVIYDAEDRPHRQQLLEAYARFRTASPDVACLQAPLIIANAADSWLSSLFALEYSGLFRRLLPYLGRRHQPMPLGGTSNHFRVDILRKVGAWDPYNVTEDADLGLRLYRMGYRADTLTCYTVEDAPTDRSIWLGQRTRWFKGWMQTWLVFMRHPVQLTRELGISGMLMFHILVTGMLVSALGHPLILFFVAMTMWHLAFALQATTFEICLFVLDWFNVIFAYTVFVRLGQRAMGKNERGRINFRWRYVPAYWMLLSLAAWRAVIELRRNPYFWCKTAHKPSAQRPISVE